MITLWPIKTPVTCNKIEMIILSIRISDGNAVDYFCEWWNEKTRCQDWFPEWRLESEEIRDFEIGFKNNLPLNDHPVLDRRDFKIKLHRL